MPRDDGRTLEEEWRITDRNDDEIVWMRVQLSGVTDSLQYKRIVRVGDQMDELRHIAVGMHGVRPVCGIQWLRH